MPREAFNSACTALWTVKRNKGAETDVKAQGRPRREGENSQLRARESSLMLPETFFHLLASDRASRIPPTFLPKPLSLEGRVPLVALLRGSEFVREKGGQIHD